MEKKKIIDKQYSEFKYLSDQDIQKIRKSSLYRVYKKGQVLFNNGDERRHIFFLVNGVVKLERTDIDGGFNFLHFKRSKCLFPYLDLFTKHRHYISAVAHTSIEIISIPIKIFEETISNNNQQLITILQENSKDMRSQILKVQKGTMNNANYRVITTLAIIYRDLGEKCYPFDKVVVCCQLTINDIAQSSGTTRGTASTVINKMIFEKKISYIHKNLIFLDLNFFDEILNS